MHGSWLSIRTAGGPAHYPYFQTAVVCYNSVVATETVQLALNWYQALQMQPIRN